MYRSHNFNKIAQQVESDLHPLFFFKCFLYKVIEEIGQSLDFNNHLTALPKTLFIFLVACISNDDN